MGNNDCLYCNAIMIQGVYCHETGCPVPEWEHEELADSIFQEEIHQAELEEEEERGCYEN